MIAFTAGAAGSSPLTRGKQSLELQLWDEKRLIPAHAGKTQPTNPPTMQTKAHPRSRGENRVPSVAMGCPSGSSPLTRGKR